MGSDQSKLKRTSSVGTFGRLRLDSPRAREIRMARRNQSLRTQAPQTSSSFSKLQGIMESRTQERILNRPNQETEQTSLLGSSAKLSNNVESYTNKIPPSWWIVPALVCATCYALYNIFIKLGSASIHPILGGVVLQFVAAILGSIMLLILVWIDGFEDLNYDADGIKWAVCAGVAVGAAEILSFIVSGLGVQASQSIPIIIGGSVGIGCILGFVILHEMLGVRGWIGVGMIIFGVGLVGTDPSGAGAVH